MTLTFIDNTLSLAPNPTANQITMSFGGEINHSTELVITDPTGRIIRRQSLLQPQITLDVADLQAGIYFAAVLTAEKRMAVERFVKM